MSDRKALGAATVALAVCCTVSSCSSSPVETKATVPTATDTAFGPVRLGMTTAEVQKTVAGLKSSTSNTVHCTDIDYTVPGTTGPADAIIHLPEGVVIAIDTPRGTKTDRGVGDGSTVETVRAAYADGYHVAIEETQAGQALVVTTGDPDSADPGDAGQVLGFALNDDGTTVSSPLVGGVPGFEYCSG